MDVKIENERQTARPPAGDREHPGAQHAVPYAYGYLAGTRGADGEEIDCFLGGDETANKAYVISQRKNTGGFDEHKVMLGFHSRTEAEAAYRAAYSDGADNPTQRRDRLGDIKEMTLDELKEWAYKVRESTVHVSFPVKAEKDLRRDESGQPILRVLASGTKLDATSGIDDEGLNVIGEKVAPMLLQKMVEQAKTGEIYFIESHETTLPLGWVIDAEIVDLPDGNQELYADIRLDMENPMVPYLVKKFETKQYVPDCSVGLKVIKGTIWDADEGGFVGYLVDGYWEHIALTKPGYPAYPDAKLEDVFLEEPSFVSATKAIVVSVAKDIAKEAAEKKPTKIQTLIFDKGKFTAEQAQAWAKDHDFSASEPDVTDSSVRIRQVNPGEFDDGSLRTITLTEGVQAVVGHRKTEAPTNKSAQGRKGEGMNGLKIRAAEVAGLTPKNKEGDVHIHPPAAPVAAAPEKVAESEADAEARKAKEAEAAKAAEAEAAKAFPPANPAAAAEGDGKPTAPPAIPEKGHGTSLKDLHAHLSAMKDLMKEGVAGGASPEEFKALMAEMMDDCEEACEIADELIGGAGEEPVVAEADESKEAKKDEGVAMEAAKVKEAEDEAKKAKDAEDACKAKEAEDAKKAAPPAPAGELVTKSREDRRMRRAIREQNKLIAELVESNKEIKGKLEHLESQPVSRGPLRYADASAARLAARAGLEKPEALVDAIKAIPDAQRRDLVSRAVAQDVVEGVMARMYPDMPGAPTK